jgi:hypothetical protein
MCLSAPIDSAPTAATRSGEWGALPTEVKEEPKAGDTQWAEYRVRLIPHRHKRHKKSYIFNSTKSLWVLPKQAFQPINQPTLPPSTR